MRALTNALLKVSGDRVWMDDAASDRVYLPLDWLAEHGVDQSEIAERHHREAVFAVVKRLLVAAEPYYESSRWGLPALRPRRAWAIATARRVYREIGRQILEKGETALARRSVVGRSRKVRHAIAGGVEAIVASTLGRRRQPPARTGMWTRNPVPD